MLMQRAWTASSNRPVGQCPWVELEPTDHPLALEQREGITLARVQEIAEKILHGGGPDAPPKKKGSRPKRKGS